MGSMKRSVPSTLTNLPVIDINVPLVSVCPHLHFFVAQGTWWYDAKHDSQNLLHFGASRVVSFFSFEINSKRPSQVLSLQNCREEGTLKIRMQLSHFFFEIGALLLLIFPSHTTRVIVVGLESAPSVVLGLSV